MIKVGINGFGRIGKLVFRIIEDLNLENKNIQVTAINCPSVTSLNLKYLINYDSVHNLNKYDIELDEISLKNTITLSLKKLLNNNLNNR